MERFIKGTGARNAPFNARVRRILGLLIKNPRLVAAEIMEKLDGSSPGISGLRTRHLESDPLAKVMRFRLHLQPRIHSAGAGTSFVFVHLKQKGAEQYALFESEISTVIGVIEWDRISGAMTDYLVRIAGPVGKDATLQIVEGIEALSSVEKAWTPTELVVWKSGIVDNFEPDHFLAIEDDPK